MATTCVKGVGFQPLEKKLPQLTSVNTSTIIPPVTAVEEGTSCFLDHTPCHCPPRTSPFKKALVYALLNSHTLNFLTVHHHLQSIVFHVKQIQGTCE